jgi:hypothetical protein
MKIITIKIKVIFLFLVSIVTGCEGDIGPESKTAISQKGADGIIFNFCLLNEQGEPATVFKEGENFSFYFSVTNKRNEKLNFDPTFAYSDCNDFYMVYNSEKEKVGKPFVFHGFDKIGFGAYPFDSGEAYVFEQQWMDDRDSIWRWNYGYYESSGQTPLKKGNYYSGFRHRFRFARKHEEPAFYTDTLSFNINFTIQ